MDSWGAICVFISNIMNLEIKTIVYLWRVCVCVVVVHDLEMKQVDLKTQNTE